MSEPQLERSVLEAKEREELFAIADALGTRPTSRARKGDLVSAILRATGVDVGDEPEPPRRTRARKAAAKPVTPAPTGPDALAAPAPERPASPAPDELDAPAPSEAVDSSGDPGRPDVEGSSPPGEGPASEQLPFPDQGSGTADGSPVSPSAGPPGLPDQRRGPAPSGSSPGTGGSAASGSSPGTAGSVASGSSPGAGGSAASGSSPGSGGPADARGPRIPRPPRPGTAGQAGTGAPSGGYSTPAPSGGYRSSRPAPGEVGRGLGDGARGASAPSTAPGGPADGPYRGGGFPGAGPQGGGSQSGGSQSGGSQRSFQGGTQGSSTQRGGSQGGSQTGGYAGAGTQGGGGQGGGAQGGGAQDGGSQSGGYPGGGSPAGATGRSRNGESPEPNGGDASSGAGQGSEGGDRGRFDNETGNRRNRRRRGRDRGERVAERDLPTQGPEVPFSGEPLPVSGYLDLREEGYGFLRAQGYGASNADVYVSISQVRRFSLRRGDWLEGAARPASATEKYPALLRIDTVSGTSPDDARGRPAFDDLTPVLPDQPLLLALEDDPSALAVRLIDLLSPLGKGQRALIAGAPRTGKTALLTEIIRSIEANHADLELLVLVVDERPEEVTELSRAVRTGVIATTFDRPAEEHVQVAELVVERAKRLVETGRDVVIVADGLTRLARAYNLVPSGTARILPGGIDAGALLRPLELFAAGRNIEGGGSLTFLATASVETGSRLDEVIYEELVEAANMQVRLDRSLARLNVRPAIDAAGTWTSHEERLVDAGTLDQVRVLRRLLRAEVAQASVQPPEPAVVDEVRTGLGAFLERLEATRTNQELLTEQSGARISQGEMSA